METGAETGLESPKPAPHRGTCTSPGDYRARPSPSRPAAHARALQPGRPASSLAGAHPRAGCPSRLRPLGGRSPPTPRAHTRAPLAPLILFPTRSARAASYLRAGHWRRAEGLRGLNKTLAGGGRRKSERPRRIVRARARARARPQSSLPQSTPGQSPTLLPRAARLAGPNNNGARGQVAARGQGRHWLSGERGALGLVGGRSLGQCGGGAVEGGGLGGSGGGAKRRSAPLCPARALRPLRLQRRLHQ